MQRFLIAVPLLFLAFLGALLSLRDRPEPAAPKAEAPREPTLLPGMQRDGRIVLPNQWSLRPAGEQVALGDFPVNMVLHPSGKWLAVLHAGYGDHEVVILDVATKKKVSRTILEQTFYGLCFSPDGKQLFASGGDREVVHQFNFEGGYLSSPRRIVIVPEKEKFIPAGVATDAEGKTLFVAGPWAQAVAVVPLDLPEKLVKVDTGKDSFPFTCLPEPRGKRVFVSLWGAAAVGVLDPAEGKIIARWQAEKHPTEMVLSPDGKTLFVACANSTRVSVLDTSTGKALQTLDASLYQDSPSGNTPNSLALTPDGQILFVANADANNIALFNVAKPGDGKPMGFIPSGWYPTSVRYHAASKQLLIANGKGVMPKANRHGPSPMHGKGAFEEYIAKIFEGTLSFIALPNAEKLAAHSKEAFACSPLRADFGVTLRRPEGNPIPGKVGDRSPIEHCIYIIKENRTYDQVFGDVNEGNGDPTLVQFGEEVTPNHHALAREFVLLDNFYCSGSVSADGHQWTNEAYANDYLERFLGAGFPRSYPYEGSDPLAYATSGFLWDNALKHGRTFRCYGEFAQTLVEPPTSWRDFWQAHQAGRIPDQIRAATYVRSLKPSLHPKFPGFAMGIPDQTRADLFLQELREFEQKGQLPHLMVMLLPDDHTAGTNPGAPTTRAMVADNDLALGRVVEALSKSRFWRETTIFVVEDDAQNGVDHVDGHRTVALCVSPYTRRGAVVSDLYTQVSMVATIERILGLPPMNQLDLAAPLMTTCFTKQATLAPYAVRPARIRLDEMNPAMNVLKGKQREWARQSMQQNFTIPDAADEEVLDRIIWHSVKGVNTPYPAGKGRARPGSSVEPGAD